MLKALAVLCLDELATELTAIVEWLDIKLILLLKPFSVDRVKWLPDLVAVPAATLLEYWLEKLLEASVAVVLKSCLVELDKGKSAD